MSRGLGRMQCRILEALEPFQHHRWLAGCDYPYLHVQLAPEVYDLERVRAYLRKQDAPR